MHSGQGGHSCAVSLGQAVARLGRRALFFCPLSEVLLCLRGLGSWVIYWREERTEAWPCSPEMGWELLNQLLSSLGCAQEWGSYRKSHGRGSTSFSSSCLEILGIGRCHRPSQESLGWPWWRHSTWHLWPHHLLCPHPRRRSPALALGSGAGWSGGLEFLKPPST